MFSQRWHRTTVGCLNSLHVIRRFYNRFSSETCDRLRTLMFQEGEKTYSARTPQYWRTEHWLRHTVRPRLRFSTGSLFIITLPRLRSVQMNLRVFYSSYRDLSISASAPASLSLPLPVQARAAFGVIGAQGGKKIWCPFTITRFANIKVSRYIAEVLLIGILTFDYATEPSTSRTPIGGAGI